MQGGGGAGRSLRIGALYPQTANAHYRVELPLRELERRGHHVLWPERYPLEHLLTSSAEFDVAVIHHYFGDEILEIVRRLRARGVAVIWDKDDDISTVPRFVKAFRSYGGRRGVRRAYASSIAIARAATAMTTPSAHLADVYRGEGVERVVVVENHVAPEDLVRPRQRHQGVVIGVTAAAEHATDFKHHKLDALLRKLLDGRDGMRVVSIGIKLDLPDARYVHHPSVPITDLVATESVFDIGLAPLADSKLNRARSNVKLKEYAAAGAMWLASPVGPYVGMGEEQGGLLVQDGDWHRMLDELLVDGERRRGLAQRAQAWARTQSSDRAARQWESLLRRAVVAAAQG